MKSNPVRLLALLAVSALFAGVSALGQPITQYTNILASDTIRLPGDAAGTNTSYQWIKDGVLMTVGDLRITGINGPLLSINNSVATDSGEYVLISLNASQNLQTNATFVVLVYGTQYVNIAAGNNLLLVGDNTGQYLGYQWLKDGSNVLADVRVAGVNSPVLTTTNTSLSDSGTYLLTSLDGSNDLQTNAIFAVLFYSTQTNIILAGDDIRLAGDTNGQSSSYQWFKNGIRVLPDSRTFGVRTNVLTISNSSSNDSGIYVLASLNAIDNLQTNALFVVSVFTQPIIDNFTYSISGGDLILYTVARGDALFYEWNWQGQTIAAGTSNTLTFPNAFTTASAGYYSVTVTNPVGQVSSAQPGLLFTKPAAGGTYQGIFYDTNAVYNTNVEVATNFVNGTEVILTNSFAITNAAAVISSGFIRYTLTPAQRSFSGTLTITNKTFRFSGAFSPAHDTTVTVQRPQNTPLILRMQLVTTNAMSQFFGTVSNETWTAEVSGNRLPFGGNNSAPQAGQHSLALLNTNQSPLAPNGFGYGVVKIRKDGTVVLVGQAADGTAISQSAGLSQTGDWPVYISLYRGRGCLVGWLNVNVRAGSSIRGGALYWAKAAGPDKLYPDGFSVALQGAGSTYSNQPATNSVLPYTNCLAVFYGGDLASLGLASDQVRVFLTKPYTLVAEQAPENVHLPINRSTGVISGSFTDLATNLRTPLKAIILQQQQTAEGYFLSTNTSGSFSLVRNTHP